MKSELEKEKEYIWKKIADIEQSFNKLHQELNTLQDELPNAVKNATQASKKTSEFRNKAQSTLGEAQIIFQQLSKKVASLDITLTESQGKIDLINDIEAKSQEKFALISNDANQLSAMLTSTKKVIEELTILTQRKPSLDSSIESIESNAEESKTTSDRVKTFYNQSLEIKRKRL